MFSRMRRLSWAGGVAVAAALAMTAAAVAEEPISFKEDVVPVIQIRCLECHQPGGDGYVQSGLDLRSYASLMKGTKFGPIVVPGDAMTSNFMVVVDGRASQAIRMPHERKKLTKCEIDILRRWVNSGAKNN
jgi:hypothetical protein